MTANLLIRTARAQADLTQRELAVAAGTSQPAIARYESGRSEPRADTLERILAACGCSLATTQAPVRQTHIPAAGPKGRLLRRHRADVLRAVELTGLRNPRVVGPVARGQDTATSDIDILVDLGEDGDVLAPYELRERLLPILGDGVDVVSAEVLRADVLATALREAVAL
jgi:predicted nucleotidyltransferase/DNA-binding XRE family transcriptional regulator